MTKQDRIETANKFVEIISQHGRKFFSYKDRVGMFFLKKGHIYWRSEYTQKEIYLSYKYWRFGNGGTMRQLVNALADYIRGKRELPVNHLGPWREDFCNGDLWGYGKDEMKIVRTKCNELRINSRLAGVEV